LADFTKEKEKEPIYSKIHDWFGKKELMYSRRMRIAMGNDNYTMATFNFIMLFFCNPFKVFKKAVKQISLQFR
jgi:hypothetical protein